MFGLFKAKKNEPTSSTSRTVAKDGAVLSPRTEIRPKFEIKADFGGINGWPADVSVVSYLSAQGLICAGTESGALLVYGQSFQYYRPHSPFKSLCIKRILSVGTDICLVVYNDNSLAVFRLPTLELLDSLESNWLTNSNDYPGIELSCIHVDEYAEKSLRTFVYVGTSIGDIYVIEVATSSGSIRISDFAVTLRDVEIAHPMRVTAIISDEKCLMVGYETSSLHHEDSDKDSDLDVSSFPGSPGNEFSNRFHCAVDMLVPAASSKCMGMVVIFNITKRRVRHSYITTAGVSFLLMDSLGEALYAVLRTGEILSLVACSGKSQYSSIWSTNLLSNDSYYYSDDAQQIVKQIRWLPPQTNNNNNSAAGCYFLLLNNDNIVCLSPCSAQGKMTEITSLRPQNCEEISDIHIVPVAQAKKGWTDKKNSSQHGGVFASAGLLVVTKRVPSDAYYRAKRSETGGKVSISNERYRSNTESQMVSRGVHLRIIPCPAGISMIPSAAGGATAIEIAVAIAVAITEPSPPSSVAKEKSKSSSSSYASNIDLPFLKENSLTCINALPPCSSSSSMATVLLNLSHNTCDDQEEAKKRDIAIIKIRSCSHNGQADLFGDNANIVRNEVVLAQKEINSQKQSKYEFDLLFLGQKNGTLGVWACSPTFNSTPSPASAPPSAPPSPSTPAPAPATATQASNRADQNNINQNNLRPYHAMWRQVFTFDCTSNADPPLSQRAFSPSSSPVSSPMSNIFSPPVGSATTGSAWVTVISPDEGSGLFAVGTSDGSVIVWEVCQSDSSMGGVEYLARTYAVARQTDSYKSDGTRSAERSISNSNSPSPQTSNRNLVFSWDDDEDDEEEANDDDDDDDEEEEVEVDAAIVYDIRKAIIPPDKVLSELIRRGQEEKDNRFEMKSREGSSRGSNKYPGLDTASLSLKMNLVLTNDMTGNNENEIVRDYFTENGPFQPDDVRTTFRARVAGSITSLLLLSDCLMLIIGTSEGAVWISRGMDDQSMVQINLSGMWKVSSKTPGSASPSDVFVAGFHYSVYSSDCDGSNSRDAAAPIPVVYVMFSCGNIAVICLQTLTMVAYCLSEESTESSGLSSILKKRSGGSAKKSSNDSYRDSQFNDFDGSDNECEADSTIPTRTVIACTVTDYSHAVMKRPQYKGAYIIKELDGKKGVSLTFLSLHGAVEPSPASPAASRKYDTAREERDVSQERANLRPRSQSNTDAYMSNNGSSKTSPRQYHSQLPRYLIIAVGTCIVTYDIGKFCKISSSAGRSRRSYSIVSYSGESNDSTAEVTYTSVRSGVQSSQTVGTSPIIAARHFNYTDKLPSSSSPSSSAAAAAGASCLTLVNGFGRMPTISMKEKTKLSDDDLYQKCGEFKVSSPITSPSKDERNLRKERDSESLYRDEMNSAGSEPAIPFNSSLKAGVLLGNGSCYLLQRSGLLLHYNLSESNTHSVSGKQPSRLSSSITTIPPSSSLHVSLEQESKITNYQNAFRGKQSSMFGVTVHSGPADLLKLFSKSRDKNYRRERIKFERPSLKSISSLSSSLVCSKDDNERSSERVDRDRDREKDKERETGRDGDSVASSPTIRNRRSFFASGSSRDKDKDKEKERERSTTANTKANTDSVASNMSEALRSLEERGEKLGRINNQADELNDGAHRFRDLIKQQKQDLQKKANRWGL